MELMLSNLIPDPLSQRLTEATSDIWAQNRRIQTGEKVLLKAPSGKGKSTLMHILYGLRNDYKGSASWNKKNVLEQDDKGWAHWRSNDISIVFQDLRLFTDLTVAENLMIKQSLNSTTTESEIKNWLAQLGLQHKWEQKAETLSYGERQRVAIVRSLIQPFRWLLLDEPFSHLDNQNIEKAADLITSRVTELKAGILVVDLEDNNWFPYSQKLLL